MATAVMYSALGKQEINGVVFFEAQKIGEPSEHYYEYETNHNNNFMSGTLKVDDELTVALASHNHGDELSVAILKYPKRNFNIEISYYGMLLREEDYYRNKVVFKTIIRAKYKIEKIVGQSLLEVKEHYPSPEFIAFNSCSLEQQKDIALEKALRDVKITQTSGKGLLTLEHNDILEVNGKQYTIGFDGNLPEKHDTLGNINFKFKVENGKFRLALKDWGVLEPDRLLTINAKRANSVIMEHKMTLRVPRKIDRKSVV